MVKDMPAHLRQQRDQMLRAEMDRQRREA